MKTKKRKPRKPSADELKLNRYRVALARIAGAGDGIKDHLIDWANVGKNAKRAAQEALRERCETCGK